MSDVQLAPNEFSFSAAAGLRCEATFLGSAPKAASVRGVPSSRGWRRLSPSASQALTACAAAAAWRQVLAVLRRMEAQQAEAGGRRWAAEAIPLKPKKKWLWVKNGYPFWNPSTWSQGLKPAVWLGTSQGFVRFATKNLLRIFCSGRVL